MYSSSSQNVLLDKSQELCNLTMLNCFRFFSGSLLITNPVSKKVCLITCIMLINPIQDGTFRGCSRISCNDETWHSYTLLKEDAKKYINHVTQPISSADISILSPEISNFCYIKKYGYKLHFNK